ncbi:homoserine O-acetyltransferase [Synchytrium microbalum]|uniref:Homoserine O-acetyltransferase n=1 Tax=Synchytrium microbalum TaxID=1806994 RepID=A0A507CGI2_9FUNG|nr:homoserine O-acetyltransferase [Synchytrium microbalum]TPX38329.1 homoserine O-acetyltransferase [Synchytrium microbalum]
MSSPLDTLEHMESQPENPFAAFVDNQLIAILPTFTLENGVQIHQAPVAYKTWGQLNQAKDNALVICHALSGSADVEDWWGPLIGPGRAFDPEIFFIFCGNMFGSPYGSASPVTMNPEVGKPYGPTFPPTTIRDDVMAHKVILDSLGVKTIQFVVGGSMGGMAVLEWAMFGSDYVKNICPIATCGRHSAWGISWGEAQRQAIYSDPNYCDGYYSHDKPPNTGLAAARMSALLTYRSRHSFESRFGRKTMQPKPLSEELGQRAESLSQYETAAMYHNEGNKIRLHYTNGKGRPATTSASNSSASATTTSTGNGNSTAGMDTVQAIEGEATGLSSDKPTNNSTTSNNKKDDTAPPAVYSAQSYLRYQGDKFVKRFDANCYIAITRKMDTHDVARDRGMSYEEALNSIVQPSLVIGVETDGLFTTSEQYELAEHLPNSEIVIIDSFEGHDGFLLEFDQMNRHIGGFFRRKAPEFYKEHEAIVLTAEEMKSKASKTGEAEGDVLMW